MFETVRSNLLFKYSLEKKLHLKCLLCVTVEDYRSQDDLNELRLNKVIHNFIESMKSGGDLAQHMEKLNI